MAGLLDLFVPSNNNGLLNGIDWGDAVRRAQHESLVQPPRGPKNLEEWAAANPATRFSPVDAMLALVGGPRLSLIRGIRAFHGSPANFERFNNSMIGTGEGAQSYGYGHYFAENPKTAEFYRDSIPPHLSSPAEMYATMNLRAANGDREEAIKSLTQEAARAYSHPIGQAYKRDLHEATRLIQSGYEAPKGHMYEVNINAQPDQFLNWDRVLPPNQREIMAQLLPRRADYYQNEMSAPSGQSAYNDLTSGYKNQPHASGLLQEAGIPGIKYLDQGSRGTGVGTSNYVVFNPTIVDILRKYGWMLPGAGAALSGQDNSQ